jgi:cell division protein FtsW (lipid II flippase)
MTLDIHARSITPKPLSFRIGALWGLLVFFASIAGLMMLSSLKTRLGSVAAGTEQDWLSYDFMRDHITVLSWAWTAVCVVAPSTYLIRRRHWRGLKGLLLVSGITLLALLCFLLYVEALRNGLAAATG